MKNKKYYILGNHHMFGYINIWCEDIKKVKTVMADLQEKGYIIELYKKNKNDDLIYIKNL